MTTIANFPQDLHDLHHQWHLNVTRGARAGTPGSGLEFLLFHRRFLAQVSERFRAEGRPLPVPPSASFVDDIRGVTATLADGTSVAWSEQNVDAAVHRLNTQLGTFGSADHLGAFIEGAESGFLHGWLHEFAAAKFGDNDIRDFATTAHTVEFYRIHRLIDHWFSRWVAVTAPGHVWHTVRRPTGWTPMYYGDITAANGLYLPEVRRIAVAADGADLHVLVVRTDGELWHAIRHADGAKPGWQRFHNVGDVLGRPGKVEDVACAVVNRELHVCTVTEHGRLMHTIRYPDRWQPWGDATSAARSPGNVARVSCAAVRGTLHVVVLSANDRRPWHTIRYPDRWQPMGNVAAVAGDRGWMEEVDCAGDDDGLHVVAVNSDGKLWHTLRQSSWTPFGDVCTTAAGPLAPPITRAACAVVKGELHLCAVDGRRTVRHTIRFPATWQRFGPLTAVTESIDIPAYADLACGGIDDALHVAVVGAEHRP